MNYDVRKQYLHFLVYRIQPVLVQEQRTELFDCHLTPVYSRTGYTHGLLDPGI